MPYPSVGGGPGSQGPAGPAGADGATLMFESIQARDAFFPSRLDLLKTNLPVLVNIGDDAVQHFQWTGGNNPATYSNALWREVSYRTAPNSIEISDGLTISTGGENMIVANEASNIDYHPLWQTFGDGNTGTVRFRDAAATQIVQSVDTEQITNPTWTQTIPALRTPAEEGQQVNWVEYKFHASSTLTNIRVQSHLNGVLFLDQTVASITPDPTTRIARITFDHPFDARVGDSFQNTITTTTPGGSVVLLGNTSNIPFINVNYKTWDDKTVALTDDAITTAERARLNASDLSDLYYRDGDLTGTGGEMRFEKQDGTQVQTGDAYSDIMRVKFNRSGRNTPIGTTGSTDVNLSQTLDRMLVGGVFTMTSTQEPGDKIVLEVTQINAVSNNTYSFEVKEVEHAGMLSGTGRDWLVNADTVGSLITADDIAQLTGNSKYVGTNATGTPGIYDFPEAGDTSRLPTIYRRSTTTIDAEFLLKRVDYDGSSGDATFTIPNTGTAGFANGSNTFIENTSASNTLTLAAGAGVTIDGETSVTPGQFFRLVWEPVEGSNDIVHVYWENNSNTGGGAGSGPYNGYREKTASATLLSTETGINAYTGVGDATFTLPAGLGSSDAWLSFIDNQSSAGMLTISGGAATNVLESGQGSVIYWDGSAFIQGALKTRSNVATFPDNTNNPIQPSTSYSGGGTSYTTGANGITYGNSDARAVFLNTNLRMQTPSVYTHDLPELSLITDSEGLTITKNSNSADQNIRPFSGATIVFGNTTFTFSNPLRLTSGSVTLVKSTSIQWLVTSLTGTFIGGTTSGGSGQSQSELSSGVFFNESGSAVEIGDGVHLDGLDGNQSFAATNLAADGLLSGFAQENIPADQSGQVGRDGPVSVPKIRITTGLQIGAPLANGTRLYWYPGGVGLTEGYLTLDEDDGANIQCMRVISSDWEYSTQEFTSQVVIDTQAEWDAGHSKVHVKNLASPLDFEVPDLAEGSAEVTAVAGQQIIVHIPLGGGTLGVRPRGASTIAPKSGTGTTYTNASPFGMTGGSTAEYWVIEVNTAANGYEYYALNTGGINTLGFFNPDDYLNRLSASAISNLSSQVGGFSNRLNVIEKHVTRPVSQNPYSGASGNAVLNQVYLWGGIGTAVRVINLGDHADYGLTGEQTGRFWLCNMCAEAWVQVNNSAGNGSFEGMSTGTFFIPPGGIREMRLVLSGGSYSFFPVGEVAYDLVIQSSTGLIAGANNLIDLSVDDYPANGSLVSVPTELVDIEGASNDQVKFKLAGHVEQSCTAHGNWNVTTETGTTNMSLTQDLNASLHRIFDSTTIAKTSGTRTPVGFQEAPFAVAVNDVLTMGGSNLSTGRILVDEWRIKYILKGA